MIKPVKAFVFDVYGTLFDVHSVKELCNELFPGKGEAISQSWRKKQLEYSVSRQLMGKYIPFFENTTDALRCAIKENGENLTFVNEQKLLEAHSHLSPYPEVQHVLEQLSYKKLLCFQLAPTICLIL